MNLRLRVLLLTAALALFGIGVGAFAFSRTPAAPDCAGSTGGQATFNRTGPSSADIVSGACP